MKTLYLLISSVFLFGFSFDDPHYNKFSSRKNGGAIDNFGSADRASKRSRIISPISSSNISRKSMKVEIKNSKLASVRPRNYDEMASIDPHKQQVKNVYIDFDEIYQDGRYIGHYKIGNPYLIDGVPYYPQEYDQYEEIGAASWYGEDFDGKLTANGEIYNLKSMTAAHQTLPLPSVVRVTNLENGKSTIVRVNDRGPFAKNRIIDLSKRAAEELEYKNKGVTMVRVEYLPEETAELLSKLRVKR